MGFNDVSFMEGKKEPLTPDLVERGEITKRLLFRSDEGEVALLELGIDAKIKKYPHPKSNVRYHHAATGKLLDEVKAGESRSFANSTGRPLIVIVVKEIVK